MPVDMQFTKLCITIKWLHSFYCEWMGRLHLKKIPGQNLSFPGHWTLWANSWTIQVNPGRLQRHSPIYHTWYGERDYFKLLTFSISSKWKRRTCIACTIYKDIMSRLLHYLCNHDNSGLALFLARHLALMLYEHGSCLSVCLSVWLTVHLCLQQKVEISTWQARSVFFTRDSIYAIARICHGNSACPSVCPSVRPSVCHTDGSVKNGWS